MKNLLNILIVVLVCAVSQFAQSGTPNTNSEPVSLAALAKEPVCGKPKMAELNESIKAQPTNTKLYLERAVCLKLNNDPAFIEAVSTILNFDPPVSSGIYSSLVELIWFKPYDGSQEYLEYLVSSNPNHWFPFDQRSLSRLNRKDYSGAIEDGVRAIELAPAENTPNLWRLKGALEKLPDDKSVFALYETVFNAARKKHQTAILKLTELAPQSKEYRYANSIVQTLGYDLHSLCYIWAKRALKLNDLQTESEVLEKMVQIEQRSAGYWMRSRYFGETGRLEKAKADSVTSAELQIEENFKKIPIEPDAFRKAELYRQIGDLYFKLEKYDEAVANYEFALSIRQSYIPNLSLARQRSGKPNPSPAIDPNPCPPGIPCSNIRPYADPAIKPTPSPQ